MFPSGVGKAFALEGSIHPDVSAGGAENPVTLTDGVQGPNHPQLISRGADVLKRAVVNGCAGANGSNGFISNNRTTSVAIETYDDLLPSAPMCRFPPEGGC